MPRTLPSILIASVFLSLTGIHGIHAQTRTRANDTRPLIVCFGDSLTSGRGLDPSQAYPADLQHLLDDAGYRYRVVNEGVSGDTTKDGLDRIGHVLALHPQIVVLEFGGNDGLRGLPISQAKANLATMIERLQAAHITVALAGITLPPQYGGVYLASFDAMYPALASRFHVPLLPMLLVNVYNVPGDMQDDLVHPTAKGAEQVARNVEQLLRPLLRKQPHNPQSISAAVQHRSGTRRPPSPA